MGSSNLLGLVFKVLGTLVGDQRPFLYFQAAYMLRGGLFSPNRVVHPRL